jgi:hypothetical protein
MRVFAVIMSEYLPSSMPADENEDLFGPSIDYGRGLITETGTSMVSGGI